MRRQAMRDPSGDVSHLPGVGCNSFFATHTVKNLLFAQGIGPSSRHLPGTIELSNALRKRTHDRSTT
jgi:hypothetical protein